MTLPTPSSAEELQSLLHEKEEGIRELQTPQPNIEREKMEVARKAVIERHRLSRSVNI